ncbi:MAG UNVERIFIED_CONTAM: hypothetical protein LVQ98_00660 [Rickettsiaceae bacterium]|jgi:hypothetical protein
MGTKAYKKGAIATEDHINSCISEGALEILNVLLDNNAVVHLKNLFSAMAHAPQVVPLLMQHYNGDINKKEVMGSSLLGYAIHKNDIVAGDLLLARSDLVLDPKEDLLMMAILKMDVLWAQSLIEKGAIVTEEVLEFCTILGTPEVLKVLLSNITYIPYEMLCKAQFHENPAIYKLYQEAYIRLGAPDVNEYMQDGYTPLTGDKPMNDHDLEGLLGQNPGQQEYTS